MAGPSTIPVAAAQPQASSTNTQSAQSTGYGYKFNPMLIIVLILIFVVVFIILYTTKTNLVTDLIDGERVLNNRKVCFWTVFISIIIAILGFIFMSLWGSKSSK